MKKFVFIAIILMATIGTAFAQPVQPVQPVKPTATQPVDFMTSPQSRATMGLFGSDADDFIAPAWYNGVEFDKFYAVTSFGDFDADAYIRLGFATRLGKGEEKAGTYLGLFYGGTLLSGHHTVTVTDVEGPFGASGATTKYKSYSQAPFTNSPNYRLGVLLGIGDMGIRLSLGSTHQTFNKKEVVVASTQYQVYKINQGWLAPQVAFGLTKNIIEKGIRPTVTLDVPIYTVNQETLGTATGANTYIHKNSYSNPSLAVNLGGLTLKEGENAELSLDLDYTLNFTIYNTTRTVNATSGTGVTQVKGKGYYGTTFGGTTTTGNYIEPTYLSNNFVPSIGASWSNERVGISSRLYLDLDFIHSQTKRYTQYDTTVTLADNHTEKNSIFEFTPTIDIGIQFWAVPNKLAFNIGGALDLSSATITTTTWDPEPSNNKKRTSITNGTTDSNFALGATFNFTENVGLQAMTGVGEYNADGRLTASKEASVFDTASGIFCFSSVLLSVKF
jgi:hypothetical protein